MLFPKRRAVGDRDIGSSPGGESPSGASTVVAASLRFIACGPEGRVGALGLEGKLRLLDPEEVSLLRALERPCSAEALAERLRFAGWEDESLAELPGMLGSLAERGLVRRLGEIVVQAREALGGTRTVPAPGISVLAFPTCDRPVCLGRALASWGGALARSGGAMPDLVVADDSRNQAAETRSLVEGFASTYDGAVFLLDKGYRRRLSEALRGLGPSRCLRARARGADAPSRDRQLRRRAEHGTPRRRGQDGRDVRRRRPTRFPDQA